jgi:hypothetical protein
LKSFDLSFGLRLLPPFNLISSMYLQPNRSLTAIGQKASSYSLGFVIEIHVIWTEGKAQVRPRVQYFNNKNHEQNLR